MRYGALIIFLLWLSMPAAAAVTDEVELAFLGGEVEGGVPGQGTATVIARVTNNGTRVISGVRIEAFYNTVDAGPGAGADWRPHEFVFEPPLAPGHSSTLSFTDENAAEFIKLRVRGAVYSPGLSYNDEMVQLEFMLRKRSGVVYIATRDMANLLGAKPGYDNASQAISLETEAYFAEFKSGSSIATVNGSVAAMAAKVIEVDGRSFLPLADVARMFGLAVEEDDGLNLVLLSD